MDLVIYVARQFGIKTRSLGHFGNLRESYGGLHEVVAWPTLFSCVSGQHGTIPISPCMRSIFVS